MCGWNSQEQERVWGEGAVFREEQIQTSQQRAVLVFFYGGVSYAEVSGLREESQVAALRVLSRALGRRVFIATTHILDRMRFLQEKADAV